MGLNHVSASRTVWARTAWNTTLAETLESHLCDIGGHTLVFFAILQKSLGLEQYIEKYNQTSRWQSVCLFIQGQFRITTKAIMIYNIMIENLVEPGAVGIVKIILGHTHMLPTRDPSQDKRLIQTESEGLETNFPSKRTGKTSRGSNTHIRQNRLPKKGHKERPRRSLHKTQGKNPSRRHKYYKYICTQHRSTQIYKKNLWGLQERYWQQHSYSRGL